MKKIDRRKFLEGTKKTFLSAVFALLGLGGMIKLLSDNPDPDKIEEEPSVLRPPGALKEEQFLAACIRCQRCKDSCPKGCIKLAGSHDKTHSGTPFIIARNNACDLCLECTVSCPTGALLPVEKKQDVKMGTAVIDKNTCVSHNETGICGACFTACPLKYKAINATRHNAPVITDKNCVGCGLCEEICIVKGVKAIRVFSGRGEV